MCKMHISPRTLFHIDLVSRDSHHVKTQVVLLPGPKALLFVRQQVFGREWDGALPSGSGNVNVQLMSVATTADGSWTNCSSPAEIKVGIAKSLAASNDRHTLRFCRHVAFALMSAGTLCKPHELEPRKSNLQCSAISRLCISAEVTCAAAGPAQRQLYVPGQVCGYGWQCWCSFTAVRVCCRRYIADSR